MILESEDITEKQAWNNSGFNEVRTLSSLPVVGYRKQLSDDPSSTCYVCYAVTFRWLKQYSRYIAFDLHFFNGAASRPTRVLEVIQNSVFRYILRQSLNEDNTGLQEHERYMWLRWPRRLPVFFHSPVLFFHSPVLYFHGPVLLFHSPISFFHSPVLCLHSSVLFFLSPV